MDMELTWHGHSTWHVSVGDTDFVIDPYFDNPKTALSPSDVEDPDYLLATHGHADHIAHAGEFTGADNVVGTPEVTGFIADQHDGHDALGMNLGGTVECGDAYVTMHRADHSNGLMTDYTQEAGTPAGFLISDTAPTRADDAGGTTFYHTGDTALLVEMREVIGPFLAPDAVAVPIGDHYTMGPSQAAIAVDWLDVDHAMPMHYDTFPAIEQDPAAFEREVTATGSDAAVHVLEGDETVSI